MNRWIITVALLSLAALLAGCSAKQADLGYLKTRPAAALILPEGINAIRQRSYMVIPDVTADGVLPADDRPPRISGE